MKIENRFCSDHNPPCFVEDIPNPHPTSASKHAADKTFLQKKKWSTQARATPCARTYHLSSVQKRLCSKILTFKHVGVQHFHLRQKPPQIFTPTSDSQLLADSSFQSLMILCHILRFSPLVGHPNLHRIFTQIWAPRTEPKALKPFSKPPKLTGFKHQRYERFVCLFGYLFLVTSQFWKSSKIRKLPVVLLLL